MSEFTDELKRLDLAINLPSKTYFALEEKFKDWQSPKQLVEVPQIVAYFIKTLKIRGIKPLMDSATFGEIGFTEEKRDEILHWINEHQEEYMRAWLDDYTVEKEQMFYLREKNTDYYLTKSKNHSFLKLVVNPYFDENDEFTQSEIDELETGSYEQIAVKVDEAEV